MKTLIVLRKHVLDAIKFNHLVAGAWFQSEEFTGLFDLIYKPNCNACLVGSTVRRAAKHRKVSIRELDNFCDSITFDAGVSNVTDAYDIEKHLKKKHYLAALSCKFESTITKKARKIYPLDGYITDEKRRSIKLTKKEQEDLKNWVKKNIPVKFTVTNKG